MDNLDEDIYISVTMITRFLVKRTILKLMMIY